MGRPLRALYANGTFNALSGVANTTEIITTTWRHGFSNGMAVVYTVSTGNTAISGLTSGSTYYVINAVSGSTTLQLSTTLDGTAINLTAGLNETGHTITSTGSPATGVIEMSDPEILDVIAPLTQNYHVASPAIVRGLRLRAVVSSAEDLIVGTFSDIRNAAVGTHPSSNTTISTKTLYQNIETQAIASGARPVQYAISGAETKVTEMSDADLIASIYPAVLNAIVTGGVGGYYLSLTSSGAPGTGTWESAVTFDDTYYVGSTLTTDNYTLWHRIDAAPVGTLRPLKIITTANETRLTEMSDTNIEQVGRYIGEYVRTTGIGSYALQQSTPGTGTWISRGSIANKVNDLTDIGYTGYYDHSFTGAFSGAYTGAFTGNYTGSYTAIYSRVFTGAYTGSYSQIFSGAYTGGYVGGFTGTYAGSYVGGYVDFFTGAYSGAYSQTFVGTYTGAFSRVFTSSYTGIYTGIFNQAFVGSYSGSYNQTFTGSYSGSYNQAFVGFYSGTYTRAFTGSYSGAYNQTFTGSYSGSYSNTYTGIVTVYYSAAIPHSYTGIYQLAQYTANYSTAVVLGYMSAPTSPRNSGTIVGHAIPIYYTHQSGPGGLFYTSTRYDILAGPHYSTNPRGASFLGVAYYPVTYVGYYSPSTFTHTTFGSLPKMSVAYNPRGAAVISLTFGSQGSQTTYNSYYSGQFTGIYTGYYASLSVVGIPTVYTAYYTGAYSGGYVGTFTGAYSGGYSGAFTGAYAGSYTKAFTGAYSGSYVGVFTGAYSGSYTRAFTGAYSGTYSGSYTGAFTGAYSGSYVSAFTGAYSGSYTSVYLGTYSGLYTGSYGNTFTGTYTGGYVGSFTGAYSGGYVGAFTGAYSGTYVGAYSQSFTGIYNQAFTRAFTAVWTGLTVQTTLTSSSYTLWVRTA